MDDSKYKAKRREIDLGLANNAFGATAGVIGTRAVYRQARAKRLPAREAAYQQKVQARQARRAAAGPSRLARVKTAVGRRIPGKVRPYVAPALVGGAVAMQGVNAAADAQSASYFARERKNLMAQRRKAEPVLKSDSGMTTGVDISKASWDDTNARRVNQQGLAAGGLGALGLTGGAISGRNLLKSPYEPPRKQPLKDKHGKQRRTKSGKLMYSTPKPDYSAGGALRIAGRSMMANRKNVAGFAASAAALPASALMYRRSKADGGRAWS